jgi:hypothetical protein
MLGHGGDISLARSTDEGTVFRLSLPIEPNQRERPTPTLVHGKTSLLANSEYGE